MDEYLDVFVCLECIGDDYLKNQILKEGNLKECSFCNEDTKSISINVLGDKLHKVLEEHFRLTPSEPDENEVHYYDGWYRDGYHINDCIQDILNIDIDIDEDIIDHLISYLSFEHDETGKHSMFVDQPYDSDAHYVEKEINSYELIEDWRSFKLSIRATSRYFNVNAKKVLDRIFENIEKLITSDNKSVIQEFSNRDLNQTIYRARVAFSDNDMEEILNDLPKSLGAPPHKYASGGRMNAKGISVFYGALDLKTCITEVRAPVGSIVIIAGFKPVRTLKILDLSRLQRVFVKRSYFDDNYLFELERASFLEKLIVELSLPVLPGSEEKEYLPTQFIAEYFAQINGLGLDGVIFDSSQSVNEGKNFVLFNHASGMEEPENLKIEVNYSTRDPYDDIPLIKIREVAISKQEAQKQWEKEHYIYDNGSFRVDIDEEVNTFRPDSLRLDLDSIKVLKIDGISYESSSIDVKRYK